MIKYTKKVSSFEMDLKVRLLAALVIALFLVTFVYSANFVANITINDVVVTPVLSGESVAYYLKVLNKSVVDGSVVAPAEATTPQTSPTSQPQTSSSTSVLPQQPLLTSACIDNILAKSPAKGNGVYFVQYGQEFGVDPAFALAMFRQENSLCNSDVAGSANFKGCLNKSISNIMCTTSSCYEGFNTYPSWQEGVRAFYSQLKNGSFYLKAGNTTVETIYPKWADVSISSQNVQNVKDFLALYRERAKTC